MARESVASGVGDAQLLKAMISQNKDVEILKSIKVMLEVWPRFELEDVKMRGLQLSKHLKI